MLDLVNPLYLGALVFVPACEVLGEFAPPVSPPLARTGPTVPLLPGPTRTVWLNKGTKVPCLRPGWVSRCYFKSFAQRKPASGYAPSGLI